MEETQKKRRICSACAALLYLLLCVVILAWSFTVLCSDGSGDQDAAGLRVMFFVFSPILLLFQSDGWLRLLDGLFLAVVAFFAFSALRYRQEELALQSTEEPELPAETDCSDSSPEP